MAWPSWSGCVGQAHAFAVCGAHIIVPILGCAPGYMLFQKVFITWRPCMAVPCVPLWACPFLATSQRGCVLAGLCRAPPPQNRALAPALSMQAAVPQVESQEATLAGWVRRALCGRR
jgi:hypothetical protein